MSAQQPSAASSLDIREMSKRFGALQALDDVSLHLAPGTFHALLGENGAGKSTFAKCLMGYYRPDSGEIFVDGQLVPIANPRDAHAAGLGMVYQHFSLVPHMTVAENLVIARFDNPFAINWRKERRQIQEFLDSTPFQMNIDRTAGSLAAGEKQKVELLKQIYLGHRSIILDEPTTVLTPDEASQLLGKLKGMCRDVGLSILLITHKFREVFEFADEVSVLRRGRRVAHGAVDEFDRDSLADVMVGSERIINPVARTGVASDDIKLEVRDLLVENDEGMPAVFGLSFAVHGHEILGIAGVSGNGQRELVEVLAGQRDARAGTVRVHGQPYGASRREIQRHKFYLLPEEPLYNACARNMTVAENLAIRDFDAPPKAVGGMFLNHGAFQSEAIKLIERYGIKTQSPDAPVVDLSGGNVQRTVLARELSHDVEVLVAANPCMGLDVSAISEIQGQLAEVRNKGAAVLLVSEDLDELVTLSDRLVVMFEGRLVYETRSGAYDIRTIGRCMAGEDLAG